MAEKSEDFIEGYKRVEDDMYKHEGDKEYNYPNPFTENTDQWIGYESGVYDFTQK